MVDEILKSVLHIESMMEMYFPVVIALLVIIVVIKIIDR